jgi:LPS-assembly protein
MLMVLSVMLCGGAAAVAASKPGAFDAFSSLGAKKEYNAPIEADAEELDYDKINGIITASGNVVIKYGVDELRADKVLINVNTGSALASGNVIIKRSGQSDIKGSKVEYNFKTRTSSIDDPEVSAEPFHVVADKVTQSGKNEYVLHNAKVTTCEHDYPHSHYHFKAKRITLVPGEYMKTRGAVLSLGRVPVMYLPYWKRNLNEDSGFRFVPGYRSRMGGYLLSSYYHRINPSLKAEHHIDYRSERGFALGEDLDWHTGSGIGNLKLYYAGDDEPMDENDIADGLDIDDQRYRIHFEHNQTINESTLLLLQANYLSDPKVVEDFFNREYRRVRQPETYASLSHSRKLYTLTALANVRMNDFYSNVNRLPELSLNFNRTQISDSSFYYESYTSLAQLERVWEEGAGNDDYSSMRFDTRHMIYQPRRYMGWLNLIPRVGYRGTYYSDTLSRTTSDGVITTSATNTTTVGGISTSVVSTETTTNSITDVVNEAGQLRNMFEIGAEVSFKAFKIMKSGNMRHIVEPYANYTFRTEPDVLPEDLYQFDRVDELGKIHQTLLGVRNKFQDKRNGRPHDLADINTYTTISLDPEEDEDAFDKLYLDSDFYPTDWLYLNLYGIYSVAESELEEFNTRFHLKRSESWKVRAEHRYRLDDSNLLTATFTVYPNARWGFNVFGRYEFEDSRVQEQGGYIEHKLDCIGMRLGGSILPGFTRTDGSEEEDEYRVMLSFWLTAFPEFGVHTEI